MENIDKNKFFKKALDRASKIVKNNDRLKSVIIKSGEKLGSMNIDSIKSGKFIARIKVITRMVKSYRKGLYRDIEWQTLVLLVAALVYFITPIDLIPDFVPITGFVDDITVVVWIYNKLQSEIDKYIAWETSTLPEAE
ncbi:MAG: DUF1232 domain-containing protein [Bacteroidota bacterium]